MQKVLIITYYWPPGSGAGVQRWLKFSKYLPSFGWQPVILTVDTEYASYPATDYSLMNDIPSGIQVYKTPAIDYFRLLGRDKSKVPTAGFAGGEKNSLSSKIAKFIRGNFFIPDPRRGWNRYAFRKACELIIKEGIRNVITTSPPHSTQLIGLRLKRRFPEIIWTADLRDPWTDIYYYRQFRHTFPARKLDQSYERKVLESADRIITVGNSLRKLFALKAAGIENKLHVLTNGYDEDDFRNFTPAEPPVFTITYTGTLSEMYPVDGFLYALKQYQSEGNDFLLRFAGMVPDSVREKVLSVTGSSNAEFIPYLSHAESIMCLAGSSILLLVIPDHESNRSIITGKLFEYLASGKPILCLGPTDGDAAEILRESEGGECFEYSDSGGILSFLIKAKGNKFKKPASPVVYSRSGITEKLSGILNL